MQEESLKMLDSNIEELRRQLDSYGGFCRLIITPYTPSKGSYELRVVTGGKNRTENYSLITLHKTVIKKEKYWIVGKVET